MSVECHFQQYFSDIVAVSFIGGGKQSTRNKPPPYCLKALPNKIVLSTPRCGMEV